MAPAWALHRDTSPASQPGLLCPWVHRFSQNLLHCGLSMGVTASFAHPCAPMCGILHSRQVDLCLIHNGSPWDTGAQLSHYCLYHRLQENLFSNAWNTYWPFFFTGLSVCWAFSLFSLGLLLLLQFYPPSWIHYPRGAATVSEEHSLGLSLSQSHLALPPSDTGKASHWGQPLQRSHYQTPNKPHYRRQ